MANDLMLLNEGFNGAMELDLKESSAEKGLLKFKGKFQEAEAINKNKRLYPFKVLDENIQRLMDVVKSRGLVGELDHPCLTDSDFRVLTINGWKAFSEIRIGDQVWSNYNGTMVKSLVKAITDMPYDGPAYKVKGRSMDCTFTPGHKFLVTKRQDHKKNNEHRYATITEIHNNREKFAHSPVPKTASWQGANGAAFRLGDYEFDGKKFCGFLGIYLAEGCLKKKSNRIEICQTNEHGKALLRSFLPQLNENIKWKEFDHGFYTTDACLYQYLIPLGNKYSKYIPAEIKNLEATCLKELIHWYAVGDGRMLSGGKSMKRTLNDSCERIDLGNYSHMSVFSVSKRLVDDLHECLVKTGGCGTRSTIVTKTDYVYAGRVIQASNKQPLYQLTVSRSKYIHLDPRFLQITQTHHMGRIYCLTTEHGNFYMERKGKSFWTGNSDSIIHFKEASHVITKLWWDGNVLMGEGEVLTTAHGRQLKELLNNGVRVGISSRGVGNGKVNENGILVIGESFRLITFDSVSDPSTFAAFQEKVIGSKHEDVNTYQATPKANFAQKEVLLAALRGICNEHTRNLKKSL